MTASNDKEPSTAGWDAINVALAKVYGQGEPPYHYGTVLPAALGGKDPLQGISVYQRDAPVPHWHYITYGFSELYDKESEDPEVSGFGFEMTFRLALYEEEPPRWALNLLQNLARYVFRSGNPFDAGHYLDCQGPIALGQATDVRAIVFAPDSELSEIETPNGKLRFLQVVGITLDELRQIKKWNAEGFLEVFVRQIPLLVTDLGRTSVLSSEAIRQEVDERSGREGSSTSILYVGEAHFARQKRNKVRVVFGANGVMELKDVLPARLQFAQPLTVASSKGYVVFNPGAEVGWREQEKGALEITLPPESAGRLADLLQPRTGDYVLPDFPDLVFEVRKSEIKDQDGNVVEVIG
jgi:hypothetical protein